MSQTKGPEKARRPPGPVTGDYLFRAAVHYLERYASSAANLRRVLERKVQRRSRARGEEPDPTHFEPLIAQTIGRLHELRLLDDIEFARARVASLRRKGASRRQVEARLAQKGVERDVAEGAMAADETVEAQAALAYARRRRLGPFRLRDREERRDRDVAAMMRAGFSFRDAAETVDGDGAAPEPE